MTTHQELTAYLERVVRDWPRDPYFWHSDYQWCLPSYQVPVAQRTTPQDLAQKLLADADFRVLQLGTWLQSPNGELIEAAVEALAPPPYRQDIELLADAIKLAANIQRSESLRGAALAGVVLSVAAAGVYFVNRAAVA